MKQVFSVVLLIFGTVVGSGFSSGSEIVVFFSRFGRLSYLFVVLAVVLFCLLFYFFLRAGVKMVALMENNKLIKGISLFVSIVFASSMFAGTNSLFAHFSISASWILTGVLIVICLYVVCKGVSGLERANALIMPLAGVMFVVVLGFGCLSKGGVMPVASKIAGWWYCPLYVALNTSTSGLVFAKAGSKLTKKQALLTCLFSSLLLAIFLLFGNFVIRNNPDCYASEMPFLTVAKSNKFVFVFAFVLILLGCATTLLSLCFTIKNLAKQSIKNDWVCNLTAVFLPFVLSGFGFAKIVAIVYPLCSVLGVFVLLFSIFSFYQTYKVIHQKSKNTQNGR